jgi:hypothetical protein
VRGAVEVTTPIIEQIALVAPGLTERDLLDLGAANEVELAELLSFYVDAGKVADHGAWAKIGKILQESAPYFALGGAILGIVAKL